MHCLRKLHDKGKCSNNLPYANGAGRFHSKQVKGGQYKEPEKKHHVQYSFLFMKPSGDQLSAIANFIESGKIKPIIDKVFPFNDAQKAMEYAESGSAKGKIILKIR